jgi:hypothetical protein
MLAAALLDVHPLGQRAAAGADTGFLVLASFVVSFLLIRTSARMTRSVSWWPGGVKTEGGVHVHHLVWGICLMMVSGFLAFATPMHAPWWHVAAIAFGVGAGFTLDEFALWVHLDDVYWTQEGRASLDAVVVAVAFAGLVVLGTQPFGLDDAGSMAGTAAAVTVVLVLSITCFLKGRILLGVIALFIPLVGLAGAVRLGRPMSPWARRRYRGERLARSRARFATDTASARFERRLGDVVAGAPSAGDQDR